MLAGKALQLLRDWNLHSAYKGSPQLLDYSSTKGAIVAFTRSLALSLVETKIRVNGVAPGPIWTPLIPSTFDEEKVASFGEDVPMKRAGQPEEVAPSYLFWPLMIPHTLLDR